MNTFESLNTTSNVNAYHSSFTDSEDIQSADQYPNEEISQSENETNQNRTGMMRFVLDILETLVISLILFAGVNLISARIRVEGFSMEPSFHNGELIIVNKLAYKFSLPERGDVIIFHYPRNPKEEFIKRVVGLPGEMVSIKDGKVYIEGVELNEPYISSSPQYQYETIVPPDSLFVLGDNRNNSSDSHNWGSLPLEMVIGKAVFVYWPPSKIGVVEHYSFQTE